MSAKKSLRKHLQCLPFLILLLIAVITICSFNQKKITRQEAILLAQKFIIDNGYTSFEPNPINFQYELMETDMDKSTILSIRKNTLHSKAFCIGEDEDSFDVGFLSTTILTSKLSTQDLQTDLPGRAVIVDKDGKSVRIAHKDPRFSFFTKL